MEITVKGKTIVLKKSFRAIIIMENVSGKPFSLTNTTDFIQYLFCLLYVQDDSITLDDVLEYLDSDPNNFSMFLNWLQSEADKESSITSKKKEEGGKEKL